MQVMKVDELIPHKMNDYFFDDITGEPWEDFLRSIKTSGVIEPIIATQDKVIVSGHQRIRACKKLGIKEVAVEIRHYESDDEVLKQLIETNICQRGLGNTNPVKLGRCIKRMEEFYGIAHGGDRKSSGTNDHLKTQDDLASELEMSKRQMAKYKSLTDLIPELQDAVQSGQITATTAMGFVKKLSPEEQKQLAEQISGKDKVSGSEIQKYIEENKKLRSALSESEAKRIAESGKVKEVIREVEVIPDDYVKAADDLKSFKKDYQRLVNEKQKITEEMLDMKKKVREMEERENISDLQKKLERESEYLETQILSFIRNAGGYVWITEKINDLPEEKRISVINAIKNINAWAGQMLTNIGGTLNGK